MRFLVDENLSPLLAAAPRDAGHDAAHARDIGMERAGDPAVLQAAREQNRIVVSADTDFGRCSRQTAPTAPQSS